MSNVNERLTGDCYVTKEGIFLYPEKDITSEDVLTFIRKNQERVNEIYNRNYDLYTGNHDIIKKPIDATSFRPDNRIVSNWANYVVDTYVGYFMGKPAKISLDDKSKNELLQDWLNNNGFQDKLAEVAKQVAIYGSSYMLAYQDEDGETRVAVVDASSGFMIYDTSINRKPLAFVRYAYFNNELIGELYTQNAVYSITNDGVNEEPTRELLFKAVPAIEFYASEERLSLIGKIITLINAYDNAFSKKANQVDYFDQAYLKIIGLQLERDKQTGEPILDLSGNKVIYSPTQNTGNVDVDFISKPDGDNMQENMLNRILNDIFQTAMVANLNDEAFSGNSSGVAIRYKLLAMQNQAAFEERKFKLSLRRFLGAIATLGKIVGSVDAEYMRKELNFDFKRNIPINEADEANTAKTLEGIVSKETQLKTLTIVDDPKAEIERMNEEKQELVKQSLQNSISAIDMSKGGVNNDSQEQAEQPVLEEQRESGESMDREQSQN